MKVYISSDHGGFNLKSRLIDYLKSLNHEVIDLGPEKLNPTDDYPIYTEPLAEAVSKEKDTMGIVICRNGVGVSIVANKIDGIRCGLSFSKVHAQSMRKDDNTNVLALPADYISEVDAEEIVKTWLETPFKGEDKYVRRLKEIEELEEKNQILDQ